MVAKDADKVSLGTMAALNKEMIARAREGKVKPDDISGSTFTVSNLGAYGVEHFLAIINPPEAGILAIGAAQKVPVVKEDGTLGVGNRMKVTISVDHRVSDGAEGAQFMQRFKADDRKPDAAFAVNKTSADCLLQRQTYPGLPLCFPVLLPIWCNPFARRAAPQAAVERDHEQNIRQQHPGDEYNHRQNNHRRIAADRRRRGRDDGIDLTRNV